MDTFGARTFASLKTAKGGAPDLILKAREDQFAQGVRAFVDRWTARRTTEISGTSWRKIGKLIANIEADPDTRGSGEAVLGRLIREQSDDISVSRAKTIARTETHSASQDASFTAAQSLGIDIVKVWSATHDNRTRDDHMEADGQVVAMHEYFEVGDDKLMYPGDPSGLPEEVINCRCICTYEPAEDHPEVMAPVGDTADEEDTSDE